MVRFYHLIMTAYGFWLPNDPRGSWSDFVGSWELQKFGPATTTTEKRSLARDPHDVAKRLAGRTALKYPQVRFDDKQRALIAEGFGRAVAESGYAIYACCIGHDHVHMVIARHARTIEQVASHLQVQSDDVADAWRTSPAPNVSKPSRRLPDSLVRRHLERLPE